MGLGGFLGDVGDGIAKGLEKTVQGFNVVDRYINPFHEEETLTARGERAAEEAAAAGKAQPRGLGAPGLEQTMAGMRWLYSNGISQPLSTFIMVGSVAHKENAAAIPAMFDMDKWSKAWNAANHISPGQAAVMDDDETVRAINSPLLYYKPAGSFLPPGFNDLPQAQQQEILKEVGMPVVGNAFIEQKRENSAWFKYGTGAIDFGSVMFLDPTIMAGKGVGALHRAKTVKAKPAEGWTSERIDELMADSQVKKLMDGIWANKDNPQLLNNTTMAQRSAMGPRFGAIVSTLNDPEELALFIRTGMGDVRAMDELTLRNEAAGQRMRNDTSRLGALDLMHTRYANFPSQQRLIELEMKRLNAAKNADATLVERYDEIIRQSDMLDQLNVSRWSLQRAAQRTEAQNEYLIGPARGGNRPVTIRPGRGPVQFGRVGVGMTYDHPVPIGPNAGTPIEMGLVKSQLWGGGDFFSGPVTLVRMLKEAHPNGYMRLDTLDGDSIRELRAHLARTPGIKEETRGKILNDYLKTTTEGQRKALLDDVGRLSAAKVAERYGFEPEYGAELYRQHTKSRQGEVDNMQRYSAALRSPEEVEAGMPLHIDEFTTQGGKVALSPFTVTRLINGHTFQNLDEMGRILKRHGSALKAIRIKSGNVRDAVANSADYMSYLWKFSTLFRLGYIPRVLSDDLAGQVARLGAATMAMRIGLGVKNGFTNMTTWIAKPALEARRLNALEGVKYADEEMGLLKQQIKPLESRLAGITASNERELTLAFRRHQAAQAKTVGLDPADLSPKALAQRQFAREREQQLRQAELRVGAGPSPGKMTKLNQLKQQHDFLERFRGLSSRAADDYANQQLKVTQGSHYVEIDGQIFPAAFGGKPGEYYHAQISADESVGNIFATNKQILQGNLERSFDHGAKPISAAQDPVEHLKAWTHAINNQIMQDPLQKRFVSGEFRSWEDAAVWMKSDARGIAYRKRLPKMIDTDDIARSQLHEVNQYLHIPEIRMKALEEGGVNPEFLERVAPQLVDRPDVHIGQVGQSQLHHANTMDRVVQKWFEVAATIPANRMSRHPLFNQLYEGHLKSIVNSRIKQGAWEARTVEEVERMASSAQALALRDTRRLVFDIAHRSDAAAAMRFISPFFSATAESFQRWGRIIADKPQVVGYASAWYNAPLSLGVAQDLDGNEIRPDGKAFDPVTGTWRMVPKSERYIVTRVPKWVAESPLGKAFNITEAGGKLALSQNSMNLITQGDPFFNPGVGPVVQIPVNEFVKDKPRNAEVARELGILPYGPATGGPGERVFATAAPKVVRDFLTAYDTSDQRYQQIKLQIMQRSIFEHKELGKPLLTPQQIADRTRNYWLFSASSAFLQPMATQRKDPYQFFRDQYNNLRRNNPKTADDEYLERYGESHFIFAQEITESQGIAPTMKAVDLTKKWGDLIAKNPDLAPLIIGPDGDGPFSREAYAYELNHPLVPGGAEMMRSKMSADEAMKENKRRLGWSKFTGKMNSLTAQLHQAGFETFEDEGAEDFKDQKKAWTSLYAEPLYPDGTTNPYYNEEWSKDFFTQDRRKYDRLIPALTRIARSPLAEQRGRSDLRVLQQYLGARRELVSQLNDLRSQELPHTLAAEANSGLRYQWVSFVDGLIESDTRFGDLYYRYLSRDMDVDVEEEAGVETEEEGGL